MRDRLILRLTADDEARVSAILDALRHRAGSYQERYPTRTKAVREALQVAAAQLAAAAAQTAP